MDNYIDPSKRQSGMTSLSNNGTSSKPLLLTTMPLISTTDPFQKGVGMKVSVSSLNSYSLPDTYHSLPPRHLIHHLILIDHLITMHLTSHWSKCSVTLIACTT